jgi:hypothetical protein
LIKLKTFSKNSKGIEKKIDEIFIAKMHILDENARALGLSSWARDKNRTNLDKSQQDLDFSINIFKEK